MTTRSALLELLEEFAARAGREPLTLGHVAESLGGSSFSILCIVLSLPFLAPVSLGPLATAGGLTLALLGWQLLRGASTPHLPQRVRRLELTPAVWRGLLGAVRRIVVACTRFSRPRLYGWVEDTRGENLRGWIITSAGLLMAVPLFGMPFNNALPALAIVLACLGELEDDGVLVILALATCVVAGLYIGGVLVAFAFLGERALDLVG
ncbi:MAG: exopolysaccharide biosynthesis protein [Gammaproteobacteria bacterium]